MKNMFSVFASVALFAMIVGFTSCKSQCDCTNCGTAECCSKCSTEQVETPADSTSTVTDTVELKESL